MDEQEKRREIGKGGKRKEKRRTREERRSTLNAP